MTRFDLARSSQRAFPALLLPAVLAALTACGGGGGGSSESSAVPVAATTSSNSNGSTSDTGAPSASTSASAAGTGAPTVTSQAVIGSNGYVIWLSKGEAVRLAHQATFGPTEALVKEIESYGATGWITSQIAKRTSRYTHGGDSLIHTHTSTTSFCEQTAYKGSTCWRDWYSTQPLLWDFYRNAVGSPDQLRQRVAFALSQIVVMSNNEVEGTYGLRNYYNALLDGAFGTYRNILKKVMLSPVMGDYLNNVNNDKAAPNENFARELLQLFSIGTCELNPDGTLKGGACDPTYDNNKVREYAFALTGWTYPAGGKNAWNLCWPEGTNCRYYNGDMVNVPRYHDTAARSLLSGVTVPAGSTGEAALEKVLDSLMAHPNTAPFISRQLIQHLVTSNPTPAYVQRVAQAFTSGRFQDFGSAQRGDLAATVAAILLDPEALRTTPTRASGKLREPVLMFTGVLRALGGYTDGDAFAWYWGEKLQQHAFRPPTVFSYFPPDYPVAGTTLAGPAFGIHTASTAIERLNFLNYLLWWGGSSANASVPDATGTKVHNLSAFEVDAGDPAKLVDRLSLLALGKALPSVPRAEVIKAVEAFNGTNDPTNWPTDRVRQAAWLIFASPNYLVTR